jgi:hypothetical protein
MTVISDGDQKKNFLNKQKFNFKMDYSSFKIWVPVHMRSLDFWTDLSTESSSCIKAVDNKWT